MWARTIIECPLTEGLRLQEASVNGASSIFGSHYITFLLLSVRCMMFGFGDDQVPFTESVDLLEDLVVEYITEMVRKQDCTHI